MYRYEKYKGIKIVQTKGIKKDGFPVGWYLIIYPEHYLLDQVKTVKEARQYIDNFIQRQ